MGCCVTRHKKSGAYKKPIVTQIVTAEKCYEAEDYHQNYFRNNPNGPYSRLVIAPKLRKLRMK